MIVFVVLNLIYVNLNQKVVVFRGFMTITIMKIIIEMSENYKQTQLKCE